MDIPFKLSETQAKDIFSTIQSIWPKAEETTHRRPHDLHRWSLHGADISGNTFEDLRLTVYQSNLALDDNGTPVFTCLVFLEYDNGYLDRGIRLNQNSVQVQATFPDLVRADALRAKLHELRTYAAKVPPKVKRRA